MKQQHTTNPSHLNGWSKEQIQKAKDLLGTTSTDIIIFNTWKFAREELAYFIAKKQ